MRLALAVLAALVLAAPAQASVKVTWPQAREYAPGERIAVKVKADRKVRVAVLRVSASGKVMGAIARRTVKRGAVRATLARAGTYEVRVGRRARTFKAVPPPPPEAPAPPPSAPAPPPCPGAARVTLEATLSADRVQRGQALPFTVTNTSDACVWIGVGYGLEYQTAEGEWNPVPWELLFPAVAVSLDRGATMPNSVHIPADAPLGTYRLVGYDGLTEPTFEVVD